MLAGALTAVALAALLSGCAQPGQADGAHVAEWIDSQDWVQSATASVSTDPWSPSISLTMQLDPDVPDDELYDLAAAADEKAGDAGWSNRYLTWELGDGRSFSNLGGGATAKVFFGMRHDPRYLVASARGSGDCGPFFCVTVAESDPEALQREVEHLLELADAAGGVQENLEFDAVSADGRFTVTSQPDASSRDSVALWQEIAQTVPLQSARAWVVQPVGDIPAAPMLTITVADEAAAASAEQIAATQSPVEVTVTVSGSATPPAP